MANNASTLKRIRQDAKKEARGKSQRTALKNAKKNSSTLFKQVTIMQNNC